MWVLLLTVTCILMRGGGQINTALDKDDKNCSCHAPQMFFQQQWTWGAGVQVNPHSIWAVWSAMKITDATTPSKFWLHISSRAVVEKYSVLNNGDSSCCLFPFLRESSDVIILYRSSCSLCFLLPFQKTDKTYRPWFKAGDCITSPYLSSCLMLHYSGYVQTKKRSSTERLIADRCDVHPCRRHSPNFFTFRSTEKKTM